MRGRKPELVTDRNTLYTVISAPRGCQSRAKVELRRRLQPLPKSPALGERIFFSGGAVATFHCH
jgi:hypothetical protein